MGARLAECQIAPRQGNDGCHFQRLRFARPGWARAKSRSRSITRKAGCAIDAKEVHVTRRVYRSGEGEYLINRQPCRLRDIRELLASTGITTEAYCIIEQGKVDALLQSSPRDRRVIFEEAAGISQFKIKKAAATRRMERVEQNLLRLSDIVDEVESRLRSVRLQAGKARRYRECYRAVAAASHRSCAGRLAQPDEAAYQPRDVNWSNCGAGIEECNAQLAGDETAGQEIERRIEASAQQIRELEQQASTTREQIAARQATLENQQARRARAGRGSRPDPRAAGGDEQSRAARPMTDSATREQQLAAAMSELEAADAECKEQIERSEQVATGTECRPLGPSNRFASGWPKCTALVTLD